MRLTSFTDYTLRTLIYLAINPEEVVTIHRIATAYAISENHLMKVVSHLSRNGTITTLRGQRGGMRLAQAPSDIRLGSVVRHAEGQVPSVECRSCHNGCKISPLCKFGDILNEALDRFYDDLDRYTLSDLTQSPQLLRALLLQAA